MWFLTVSVLRCSSAAICLVERSLFEKLKHLDLTGVRCGGGAVVLGSGRSSISPKTPTTRSPLLSGTALISTGTRVPVGRNQDAVRVCGRGGAEHLLCKQFAGASAVLRCDDGGELATANVPEKALGGGIDPADDSRLVEDVARDADAAESLLDVAADCQAASR